MAYESPAFYGTFPASTGLSQYQFVTINSAGVLVDPTTLGDALGVLVSSGTTGSTGRAGSTTSGSVQTVQFYGIAKVLAASTLIAPGARISAVTTGAEIGWAQAAADDAALFVLGYALSDVNSTGGDSTGPIGVQLVNVLLDRIGQASTIA